jgi:hypothetical protein
MASTTRKRLHSRVFLGACLGGLACNRRGPRRGHRSARTRKRCRAAPSGRPPPGRRRRPHARPTPSPPTPATSPGSPMRRGSPGPARRRGGDGLRLPRQAACMAG